jgi:hypothetical protein
MECGAREILKMQSKRNALFSQVTPLSDLTAAPGNDAAAIADARLDPS